MPSGLELEIAIWLIVAVLSGIGELLTGSLVLLPFTIGAGVAALAAAFGLELPWVLALFLVVSLSSLVGLRGFAKRSEASAPPIQAGANRYVDGVGRVTVAIEPDSEGRVQLDGQTWRAVAAGYEPIAPGTEVRVIEVRGTALVVEAL